MNAIPTNNPIISFLKELKEHSRIFNKYQIDLKYSIGFCHSCKKKNFIRKE